MATQRTIGAMTTLLADNSAGDISAADIRDMMETLRAGHGEISITTPAETTINTVSVFEFINGTYALSGNAHNWDMNANGQLRYLGPEDRACHVAVSVSFTAAGNNKLILVCIAKNGSPIMTSEVQRKVGTGTDVGSTALHGFEVLSTNDYLSVEVANATDATNVTFETLNLFVMDMPT